MQARFESYFARSESATVAVNFDSISRSNVSAQHLRAFRPPLQYRRTLASSLKTMREALLKRALDLQFASFDTYDKTVASLRAESRSVYRHPMLCELSICLARKTNLLKCRHLRSLI